MEAIRSQIALPETEDTWEKVAKALLQLADVCNNDGANNPTALVGNLKGLSRPITSAMVSERTRLSGAGIDLVSTAAYALGSNFEPLLPLFLPTVLLLCTRTNKIFLKRAQACLSAVIEGTQLPAILPYLLEAVKDKSATLRLSATEGVLLCMNCFNPPDLEREARAKEIEAVIKTTARDANVDVRKASRKAYEAYQLLLPSRVSTFAEPLSPTTKKYLDIKPSAPSARPVVAKTRSQPTGATLVRSSSSSAQPRAAPVSSSTRDMPPPPHVPIRTHTQPTRPVPRAAPIARPPLSRPASAASARSPDNGEPSRMPLEAQRTGPMRTAAIQSHQSTGPVRFPQTIETLPKQPVLGGARRILVVPKPHLEPTRSTDALVHNTDLVVPTKDDDGPSQLVEDKHSRTISAGIPLSKSTSAVSSRSTTTAAKSALGGSILASKSAVATLNRPIAGPSAPPAETNNLKRSRTVSTRDITADATKRTRTTSTLTTSRSAALIAAAVAARPAASKPTSSRPPTFIPSRAASATSVKPPATKPAPTRPPLPTARTASSSTSTTVASAASGSSTHAAPRPVRTGGITQPTLSQLSRTRPPVVRKPTVAKPEAFKPVKSTAKPPPAKPEASGSKPRSGTVSIPRKPSAPNLKSKSSAPDLIKKANTATLKSEPGIPELEKEAESSPVIEAAPVEAIVEVDLGDGAVEAGIPDIEVELVAKVDDEVEEEEVEELAQDVEETEQPRAITPALIPLPSSAVAFPSVSEAVFVFTGVPETVNVSFKPTLPVLETEDLEEEEDLADLAATVDALSLSLELGQEDLLVIAIPSIQEPEETPLPESPEEDQTIAETHLPLLIVPEPPTPTNSIGNSTIAGERTPISSLVSSIQHGFLFTPSSPLSPPQSYGKQEIESPSSVRDKVTKFGGLGFGLGLRFGTRKASAPEPRLALSEVEANKGVANTAND